MSLSKAHQKLVFKSRFSQVSPQGASFTLESDRKCSFRDSFLSHFCFIRKLEVKKNPAEVGERGFQRLSRLLTWEFKLTIWSEPLITSVHILLFGRICPCLFQSVHAKFGLWYFTTFPHLKIYKYYQSVYHLSEQLVYFLLPRQLTSDGLMSKGSPLTEHESRPSAALLNFSELGIPAGVLDL